MSGLVSDEDLARARTDAAFRQRLMAESLDRLLALLNSMRRESVENPNRARQIREGVALAVKLADRLQLEDNSGPRAA
ncbi:MAG TPA: hypothetical protein VMI47_11985 [Pseudolabrys sp.]|nr:hypothetical protein [Pseudolabrys sp.]